MKELSKKEIISRGLKLSTTNISDALDAINLKSGISGILPAYDCPKIFGRIVTMKITAAGLTRSDSHLGINAIEVADEGDIIVIDNGGRKDVSCWGEILSYGAKNKKVAGVIIDGAFRDIDDIKPINFPVFARAVVPVTARKRIMSLDTNKIIQCGGVQVRPGDYAMADGSGVVIIPSEKINEVLDKAEELFEKEQAMIKEIKSGKSILEVDKKYNYEKMV
ncbi:MAG: RraA family protein [Actinomycetota bacterium]|nr:RraA family protein [Actinomycetota bacterium]